MYDDLELARSVYDGTLDWLCPKMELRACSDNATPLLTGCGIVRAEKGGKLWFRMSTEIAYPIPSQLQPRRIPGAVWTIVDCVMLAALDSRGQEWLSNPLLVELSNPAELMSGQIRREIGDLLCVRRIPHAEANRVRVYVPGAPAVPFDLHTTEERRAGGETVSHGWSLDHHVRTVGDATVTFRSADGGWLSIDGKQTSPFMPDWAGLMCHSLEFATAGAMRPVVISRTIGDREHVGVFSGPFKRAESNLPRPIVGLRTADAEHFWRLVELFFRFVTVEDEAPQLLDDLAAIRTGATLSPQAARLTLAVGVEALARVLLPEVPAPGWNEAARRELSEYIEQWGGDSRTKQRVLSWIGSKSQSRSVDRFYAWAESNGVASGLIDAWKLLRHPSAHGAPVRLGQDEADKYYAVVELLHRIVASAIGYDGPILETSRRGWGQDQTP